MSGCCCESCHNEAFLQRAAVANGDGDVFDVLGYPAVSFQVYGTMAGGTDVEFQFLSGTDWYALPVVNASTGVASPTGIVSAEGTYIANVVGLQKVRAVVSGYGGDDSVNVVATAVCESGAAAAAGGEVEITSAPTGASALQVQGTAAAGAAAVGNPVRAGGQYNTAAPTLDNGDVGNLELDINGNLKTREQYQPVYEDNTAGVAGTMQKPVSSATYAPSAYKEPGSVTAAFIKAAAGNVYAIRVTNTNAAIRYFQLHNKVTIPLAGETAQLSFPVPAGSAAAPAVLTLDTTWFSPSERFATGIGFAWSTTDTTYTAATPGDHTTMVRYA